MAEKELAVEVSDLSVVFGDFFAVNHISFSVSRGEIFGFLGANGAGKTTTIRVLCGLLPPSSGRVRVGGVDALANDLLIKSKVGYMSQKFTLYNDLTVEENLTFTAALRKMPKDKYLQRRKTLLDFISFDRPLNTLVRNLPGGTKQQVSLAAAMLHDPEIIFLDEPTAGVSPASRSLFWSLIRKVAEGGRTVFVTSHYMDEVEQCNRIALMREGKIIGLDTPAGLKQTTFPRPMYEFTPRKALTFLEITEIAKNPAFAFFEPYGLKFHASFTGASDTEALKLFEQAFVARLIQPSLEDVFIQKVEGRPA